MVRLGDAPGASGLRAIPRGRCESGSANPRGSGHNRHVRRRLPITLAVPILALAALIRCTPGTLVIGEPPDSLGPGDAALWVAADGGGAVYLDGSWIGDADGWSDAARFDLALDPGHHTIAVRLDGTTTGDAGAALAAWVTLPDGGFLATDGDWEAAAADVDHCWIAGECDTESSAAVDRGGYGAPPWRWQPAEMEWSTARWIQAGEGGGEGWLRAGFDLSRLHVGRWEIEPDVAVAGEPTPFSLTFVAGSEGVAEGESRSLFQTPLDGARGRNMPYPRWSPWQTDDPEGEGYVAIEAAPADVELVIGVVEQPELGAMSHVSGGRLELILRVIEGSLAPGDEVRIAWGEVEGVIPPLQARRHAFPHPAVENDPSPDYPGTTLSRSPAVRVVGGPTESLLVAVRGGAAVAVGDPVTVHVVALDRVGNRAFEGLGPLSVLVDDPLADVPETVELQDGLATFEVSFGTPGLRRIVMSGELAAASGWIQVGEFAPTESVYFGDPHGHTLASDGIWPWEASYRHADEVAALDFCALTDHAERLTDAEWSGTVARAASLDRDDFRVLMAYEWTSREAKHRCVYATGDDAPPVARSGAFEYQGATIEAAEDFWDAVGDDTFSIPHHPGSVVGPEHDWLDHDGDREPVVEIYSKHGSSECLACQPAILPEWAWGEGQYVQDGLAAGLRFGFVAGGDSHETSLGSLAPDHRTVFEVDDHGMMVWRGGLTAVWAPDTGRTALFDALRARRCYATTGARILLDLTVDGAPMGAEIPLAGPPTFDLVVGGTAELGQVELVRYTPSTGWSTPLSVDPEGELLETSWTDEALTAEAGIYYLRVIQEDGHHAWSSPVWLDP